MSEHSIVASRFQGAWKDAHDSLRHQADLRQPSGSQRLATSITREASAQTYYTIRLLADRALVDDAYRAYAYFRWLDDMLDQGQMAAPEAIAFLERQQGIIRRCYRREPVGTLNDHERMVADLIQGDREENSGLRAYINNMMAVMDFDARRKGKLISHNELSEYTRWLAAAVTEALHYFIGHGGHDGHGSASPKDETRYLAVTAAHITHMLRDAFEDAAAGYYNVPREFLESHGIAPTELFSDAYSSWVQGRVQLARTYFRAGKAYLARVENIRCRIAGYAYVARFQVVLDAIEKDDYRLRPDYPERRSVKAGLDMVWTVLSQIMDPTVGAKRSPTAGAVIPKNAI